MKYSQKFPNEYRHAFYTVVLSSLPHLPNISFPAVIICFSLWAYIFVSFYRVMPTPGLRIRSVTGLFLFLVSAGTHEGVTVEAFVSLLIFMITMKIFEIRSVRDAVIAVILCYFTIVSGMFFNDSIFATAYILFTLIFNTTTLAHIQFPSLSFGKSWKMALTVSAAAFPIMIILFLTFPRIQTGFIGRVPIKSGYTGFTTELRLGGIAELAENRQIAFRAVFDGVRTPHPSQLYWRSIVFWDFDGTVWQRGRRSHFTPPGYEVADEKYDYTITLEAHSKRWLPVLDLPIIVQGHSRWLRHDYTIYQYLPVSSRISYSVTSSMGARPNQIPGQREMALRLPGVSNPRARALAKSWQSVSPQTVVQNALDYFENNSFEYTFSPGFLTEKEAEHPIDAFLFATRKGYCEHYAASFAFLMRAAGVPARLVGGYLGGQVNPYGDYLVVRQSDAHVWVEVQIDDSGWQRVDPTTVADPNRFMGTNSTGSGKDETSWLSELGLPALLEQFKKVTYFWDMANSNWNTWVMQYSAADQNRFFSWLQFDFQEMKKSWGIILFVLVLAGATILLVITLVRNQPATDPVATFWLLFRRRLEELGIPNIPAQGPLTLLKKLESERKWLYKDTRHIFLMYVALRYKGEETNEGVQKFTTAVKEFVKKSYHVEMKQIS
ncbi:DUF3488 and transglutaminase-like domain-containing protein [Desulfopila sp. IMCC35008]|uniref:transglutaminase family protein n=1 Tax=Desulfopila sp. IMCC35008 TaxID=2653858 RepID=UPI0013D12123|nr:DUF3488 and transglutaminase-like domain-containing protein [Desulfopila sp. IMCC35008]